MEKSDLLLIFLLKAHRPEIYDDQFRRAASASSEERYPVRIHGVESREDERAADAL